MIAAIILNLSGAIMEKWFRNSLMASGVLFMLTLEMSILGMGDDKAFANVWCFIVLAGLSLSGITLISGVGLLLQSIGKGLGQLFGKKKSKAKRGLGYGESHIEHILHRLSDEERGYLEGYFSGQVYEANEEFSYSPNSHLRRKRQNTW
jgi:hypothetical protein